MGAAFAFAALMREGDCLLAGVFVWAFAGIAVATPSALVRAAAGVLSATVAVGILVSAIRRRRLI